MLCRIRRCSRGAGASVIVAMYGGNILENPLDFTSASADVAADNTFNSHGGKIRVSTEIEHFINAESDKHAVRQSEGQGREFHGQGRVCSTKVIRQGLRKLTFEQLDTFTTGSQVGRAGLASLEVPLQSQDETDAPEPLGVVSDVERSCNTKRDPFGKNLLDRSGSEMSISPAGEAVLDECSEKPVLAVEVPIHRADGKAGTFGNRRHGRAIVATLNSKLGCGIQDPLLAHFGPCAGLTNHHDRASRQLSIRTILPPRRDSPNGREYPVSFHSRDEGVLGIDLRVTGQKA